MGLLLDRALMISFGVCYNFGALSINPTFITVLPSLQECIHGM